MTLEERIHDVCERIRGIAEDAASDLNDFEIDDLLDDAVDRLERVITLVKHAEP